MATVANDSGHLVTFLALPENQWLYINERAHDCGINAERYVALALKHFDQLPSTLRYAYVLENFDTYIPGEMKQDGRPDATDADGR